MALTEQELAQLENRPKVQPFSGAQNFQPNFIYPKDTIIFQDNLLWRARDNFQSNDNFNSANWEQVAINSVEWSDIKGDELETDTNFTFNGDVSFTKPINTKNINTDGAINATGNLRAVNINASGQIIENGQRVYSPNNRQPINYDDVTGLVIEKIEQEITDRQAADQVLQNNIDMESVTRDSQINDINNTLEGVKAINVDGDLLTRVINGFTPVAKILFDTSIVFIADKTLISDTNGTIGVYRNDIDNATINVETITISPISVDEPTLLGNVDTFADLPQTITDAEGLGWNTPRIDDYARVLVDETNEGKTVEWYIVSIDTDGNITWGNPVIINTADFQEQTTAADAGKVLTGGAVAGTFGNSLEVDTVPTEGSNNLVTSNAVFEATQNSGGITKRYLHNIYNENLNMFFQILSNNSTLITSFIDVHNYMADNNISNLMSTGGYRRLTIYIYITGIKLLNSNNEYVNIVGYSEIGLMELYMDESNVSNYPLIDNVIDLGAS
jgi:hypothetical protein